MEGKIKKTKQVHLGDPLYYDENGQIFKEVGNARIYLNRETVTKIKARKKKK